MYFIVIVDVLNVIDGEVGIQNKLKFAQKLKSIPHQIRLGKESKILITINKDIYVLVDSEEIGQNKTCNSQIKNFFTSSIVWNLNSGQRRLVNVYCSFGTKQIFTNSRPIR